jgi:hypothetical protein
VGQRYIRKGCIGEWYIGVRVYRDKDISLYTYTTHSVYYRILEIRIVVGPNGLATLQSSWLYETQVLKDKQI